MHLAQMLESKLGDETDLASFSAENLTMSIKMIHISNSEIIRYIELP